MVDENAKKYQYQRNEYIIQSALHFSLSKAIYFDDARFPDRNFRFFRRDHITVGFLSISILPYDVLIPIERSFRHRINHSFLFEDPTQYSPASIYLPKEQDLLIIYDKYATVRIVDLVEGKCLTQLDLRTKLSKQPESNAFIPETEKLVMFAYNSLRQELYTINKRAHMRKWSC